MLLLLFVSAWISVGAGRRVWGDGLGGWRSIPTNARALIADSNAPKRYRVPFVLGSWAWTAARTGGRGLLWGHRSAVAGARWGYREGHERSREWEERALLRQEIVLATQRVDSGSGSVAELRSLERRLQDLEARQLACRSARGSAWIRRWHGPAPSVVDGKLQFGSDPDDRAGRADCSDCSGSGSCEACDRRVVLLADWDSRGEQSAVAWYAARRKVRAKAAEDMADARDTTTWADANVRYVAAQSADWGRPDVKLGNGSTVTPLPVPVPFTGNGRGQVMTIPNASVAATTDAENMKYYGVLQFLTTLGTELSNWGARMEIASASLSSLRPGPLTMSEMSAVDEALQNAYAAVNTALSGIQSRHGSINEVVSGAVELADPAFYGE